LVLELFAIYREHLKGSKLAVAACCFAALTIPGWLFALAHRFFGLPLRHDTAFFVIIGMFFVGMFFGCILMAIALFAKGDD
jgi:hypothetical protein